MKHWILSLFLLVASAPLGAAQEPAGRIEQARERWECMSPDERARMEQRFREFRELPEAERERMRAHLDRVAQARREIEERIPDELRAKLDQLGPDDRRQVLREYVELALGERAERLRGKLPPEFVKKLEAATPAEREAILRGWREAWREKSARRALEYLSRELELPSEEVERIRALPAEERFGVIAELSRRELERRGPPPGVGPEEFRRWLELPPGEFIERMHGHGMRCGRGPGGGPEGRGQGGPDGRGPAGADGRGPGGADGHGPGGADGRGPGGAGGPPPGDREGRGGYGPPKGPPDGRLGDPGSGPRPPYDGSRGPRREGKLPREARGQALRALRPEKEWIVELALETRDARREEIGRRIHARVIEILRTQPAISPEELARLDALSGREFYEALREYTGDPSRGRGPGPGHGPGEQRGRGD